MEKLISEPKARDDLLTREQAATYLNVATQTLSVWASTGRYSLPFIRIGRKIRYRKRDLDRWLARRTVHQGAAANGNGERQGEGGAR